MRARAFFLGGATSLALLSCGGSTASPPSADAGADGAIRTASDASHPSTDAGHAGGHPKSKAEGGGAPDAGVDAWTAPHVGPPVEAGSPGSVAITLTIHATVGAKPISPLIYGVNDVSKAAGVHASIVRIGGNRLTASNWENNASNAGSDYEFENDDFLCSTVTCLPNDTAPGAYLKAIVDGATAANAATLVTVPIVDYVAADTGPAGDVRNSGSDYLSTRFRQNKAAKGAAFASTPDTTDAFVYQDEMVHWLTTNAPGATLRFQLDNEPDLWSATHAEIHPTPVTYAELAQRNITYATAIKAVVPDAHVVGPVNYGWEGYISLQSATDSAANGDFLTWWLGAMKAAEATAGKRLVDGLDLHWYSEATGGGVRVTEVGTSAAETAAREQAPRSLWDPTYTETSWIAQTSTNGPITLIPRIQKKIDDTYPGTKLSFSEWNYGGGTDVSGAIASADVLGIYGVYGVDMAMMWPLTTEVFTYAAFSAFRNYDGHGAGFGDTSVTASTSDLTNSSVYASVDSADPSRVVIVAINKALTDQTTGIVLAHDVVYTHASVYTVTAEGGPSVVPAAPITSVATNAFAYTMPAQSVSVIVPSP